MNRNSSFLSMLPTRIAERFEFVTTLSGPGLHQSLVFLLAPLLEKTVMFGTFTNAVNETHSIRYTLNHVSHVDALHDLSRKMGLSNGGRNLDLFSHQYE